jgi:hypothetical protein
MKTSLQTALLSAIKYLTGLIVAGLVARNLLDSEAGNQWSAEVLTAAPVFAGLLASLVAGIIQHFLQSRTGEGKGSGGSGTGAPLPILLCLVAMTALCLNSCADFPANVRITDSLGNGLSYNSKDGIGVVVVLPVESGK